MGEAKRSDAAERLLDAAMRLFSLKGYASTTVGEIQEAAGLTFGSGALYKHFASKEEVLTVGIERFIESGRRQVALLADLEDLPFEDALEIMARAALGVFEVDGDAVRIVWRDLDAFPHLQRRVLDARIRVAFAEFARWFSHQTDRGHTRRHDPQAVAAIALGSLVFVRLLASLMHDTPGDVDEERIVRAWTDIFVHALKESD